MGCWRVRPCAGDDNSKRRGDVHREGMECAAHLFQRAGARHVPLAVKKPRRHASFDPGSSYALSGSMQSASRTPRFAKLPRMVL